jgi:hypothetical protein
MAKKRPGLQKRQALMSKFWMKGLYSQPALPCPGRKGPYLLRLEVGSGTYSLLIDILDAISVMRRNKIQIVKYCSYTNETMRNRKKNNESPLESNRLITR